MMVPCYQILSFALLGLFQNREQLVINQLVVILILTALPIFFYSWQVGDFTQVLIYEVGREEPVWKQKFGM